ncbi:hypothetical protein ACWF5H_12680 [Arthrobacter sp. NPDC055138]
MTKSTKYRRMGKGTVSNVLRREIRAARLKVILDQELGRPTSDEVKLLAAMDLPRIVRRNYQGDDSADRRTCDPTNEGAAAGTSRREILVARLKVSMNELLGRDTPSKAMRQSRMKLAPIFRRHSQGDQVAHSRTGGPTNKERVFETLRREILAARLKVTLDEELDRQTSPTVKRLARMKLPPIVRSNGKA